MILLDSIFINNSGGKVLLDYLVESWFKSGEDVYFLFDERCQGDYEYIPEDRKLFLKASILARHKFYRLNFNRFSKILCFGNVPPTMVLQVPVYTYFHNLLLLQQPRDFSFKKKLDAKIKALFIGLNLDNTDYFIVQSENVKNDLSNYYNLKPEKTIVYPFFEENKEIPDTKRNHLNDYVFISDGNPHKNHVNLLKAWQIINKYRPEFKLHLTVSNAYPGLKASIEKGIYKNCNIKNHGRLSKKELAVLLSKSAFIIYPSLTESFGLGLIEGCEAGCEVIASNRAYVHAVVKPLRTFEPLSVEHIVHVVLNTVKPQEKVSHLKVKDEVQMFINLFTEK
jgi:glycosyltransferase involved in cell wall biosynthesis